MRFITSHQLTAYPPPDNFEQVNLMEFSLPPAAVNFIDSTLNYAYSFDVYAAPTVVLGNPRNCSTFCPSCTRRMLKIILCLLLFPFSVPQVLVTQVSALSDQIGFDVGTLRYVLGLMLCYPLGMIMAALPYGKVRHLFSFILGAFLLQFAIGLQWVHHMLASIVAYALFLILPRATAKVDTPRPNTRTQTYPIFSHLCVLFAPAVSNSGQLVMEYYQYAPRHRPSCQFS